MRGFVWNVGEFVTSQLSNKISVFLCGKAFMPFSENKQPKEIENNSNLIGY